MKHIKKFNETSKRDFDYTKDFFGNKEEEEVEGEIVFSGETKSGWKYNVVSTPIVSGAYEENGLELTSDTGEVLDASQMLHEAVDAYIDGDSTTESFLKDIMDITEAYDKMKSLEK